jgi:DNA-binding MarR family transcriptional regulator
MPPLKFDPVDEAKRNWAQHWGDDPVPSMGAVTSIMRVQQILLARLNDVLKPFDLTFPRYEALMLLFYSRQGALPLGKMGDRLQVHRTSVTNIIDGLEKSNFVTREPHERDRRTTLARITDQGRKTAAEATAILNQIHFGTEPLQQPELDAVTHTLERLRADADGFPPERGESLRRVP